ncbi:MAG: polysaccharide deacetylase family protein [Verrucomicrobiae bacterium]|nr:polysaccharide deacetylase family protein [Verrucomicrobiae bacterium]
MPATHRGAIRRVELPPGKKLIALTLDLCEQPGEVSGYDGRIFDLLRRENVKATLFVGGKWMRSHEARTQQLMTDPLFEIANHSSGHRNLRLLSGKALADRNRSAATRLRGDPRWPRIEPMPSPSPKPNAAAHGTISLSIRCLQRRIADGGQRSRAPCHSMGRFHGRPVARTIRRGDHAEHDQRRAAGINHHGACQRARLQHRCWLASRDQSAARQGL